MSNILQLHLNIKIIPKNFIEEGEIIDTSSFAKFITKMEIPIVIKRKCSKRIVQTIVPFVSLKKHLKQIFKVV